MGRNRLGPGALCFALAAMMERFRYLKYTLALVLSFIGGTIFAVNLKHSCHIAPGRCASREAPALQRCEGATPSRSTRRCSVKVRNERSRDRCYRHDVENRRSESELGVRV